MAKKEPPQIDQAIEQRAPFGFSILCNVDQKYLDRQIIRLASGAKIKDEARFLANQSGCTVNECTNYLKTIFGWTSEEFYDHVKSITQVINRKIGERILAEINEIPTKDLIKAYTATTQQALTLDGRPSSISASASMKVGEKTVEEIRAEYMEKAKLDTIDVESSSTTE